MLAPVSSQSQDLLVINLGNLTIRNQFLMSGTPGTISHKTALPRQHSHGSQDSSQESSKASADQTESAKDTPRKVATGTAPGLNVGDSPGLGLGTAPGVFTRASTGPGSSKGSSVGSKDSSTPKHSPKGSQGTTQAEEAHEATDDVNKTQDTERCLLDCIQLDLEDMDLYSAERVSATDFDVSDGTAMIFPSFVVQRKVNCIILTTVFSRGSLTL